jgi:Flp pilus assembly protein TadD
MFGRLVGAALLLVLPAPLVSASERQVRTRAELEELIEDAGRTPPEWWGSVRLSHPETLELTWARVDGWAPERNLAQYLRSVVEPNEHRWREGAKLLHKALSANKDDPERLRGTVRELARVYQYFLGDYARAAYWWRRLLKGDEKPETEHRLALAECYAKLGGSQMARGILEEIGPD